MHYEYERLDKRGSRSDFNGRIPCKEKENKRKRKKTQEKRIRRSRRKSDASGILYGIIACMVVILVRVIVAGKLKYQRISV